jgi:putative transcriptional regulator
MPIVIKLDLALIKKKMRSKELAETIGLTEQNLSILKTGKAKALRFSTLEAICKALNCQPGDLLEYREFEGATYTSFCTNQTDQIED